MATARTAGAPSTTRTRSRAPPSQASSRSGSPATSIHSIPPASPEAPGSSIPGSRATKNGSNGVAIASKTPVSRALPLAHDRAHRRGESLGHGHDVVNGDRPAHQPLAGPRNARGQRPPELRPRRLRGVGNRQDLQIAAAERNDPVVGAEPLVAPTSGGAEPVLGLQPGRSGIQIGRSDDDVIDPHGSAFPTRGPNAGDGRFRVKAAAQTGAVANRLDTAAAGRQNCRARARAVPGTFRSWPSDG